jgi:hypothetical protein
MAREQDEGAVIALRSLDIADQKRSLATRAESALTLFGEPELARPVLNDRSWRILLKKSSLADERNFFSAAGPSHARRCVKRPLFPG